MSGQIDEILLKKEFDKQDIIFLLQTNKQEAKKLFKAALETKLKYTDNKVRLRGLIEYSNICRKRCLYCGLRNSTIKVDRYTLTDEEYFSCIEQAIKLNYGSIALQSGERQNEEFINKIEYLIKKTKEISNNSIGITLSLGEQTKETYKRWFLAGAHRYLLRIEASDEDLYYKIHQNDELHSYKTRIDCLQNLTEIGYQVGTGVMIGLPFQTIDNLANDILFFKRMQVAMIGMGPYIPHPSTPLWQYRDTIPTKEERMFMTLKMIAITRLVMPQINMVSATANQTIDPLGREKAIQVGANVIMPNLSPTEFRTDYDIYPDKACVQDTAEQCASCLEIRMRSINHTILYNDWGDSLYFKKHH